MLLHPYHMHLGAVTGSWLWYKSQVRAMAGFSGSCLTRSIAFSLTGECDALAETAKRHKIQKKEGWQAMRGNTQRISWQAGNGCAPRCLAGDFIPVHPGPKGAWLPCGNPARKRFASRLSEQGARAPQPPRSRSHAPRDPSRSGYGIYRISAHAVCA